MIPIFLASDEAYAAYMAVTIESIAMGTAEQLQFYILDGGICNQTKEKIKSLEDKFSYIRLEFISIDLALLKNLPILKYFSINTYFRYLIPLIKPDIKKALYLDTDMIVSGDIVEIYETDLNGKGIGAVPYLDTLPDFLEPKYYQELYDRLNLNPKHLYFNAGLLLMDCDYWRANHITEKLTQKTDEIASQLTMPDQDVLNILFDDNYQILKDQYNIVVDITSLKRSIVPYVKSLKGCFVLHYTGGFDCRPWVRSDVPFADIFWRHAQNTAFINELQFQLVRNEMKKTNTPRTTKHISLFGKIPLISIQYKKQKTIIKLFNVLPFLTIRTK